MKFAAVDIGSNAVRLLLSRVIYDGAYPFIKKESLVRMPIRLGEDAFVKKRISDEKVGQLLHTMKAFRHLIDAYQVIDYMACATSAMREAENGKEIAEQVRQHSSINLHIIAGKQEADIIFSNHFEEKLNKDNSYLYIDVGGGSTELTLFSKNRVVTSNSFEIGTVRLLHGLVPESHWNALRKWIKTVMAEFQPIHGIGSGGNINKMFKMSRIKEGKPMSYKRIKDLDKYLNTFSLEERIRILGMRPDRADVIVHAARIFRSVMKWGKIKKIYVPQFGLSDGVIHTLFQKHQQKREFAA